MSYSQTLNTTHLSITPTKTPVTITKISFSVLIITRKFASYHVILIIDSLRINSLTWIIQFNNDTFFNPS